ncbi:hypothetical protein Pint_34530 [Pistacia integerrima]|uniref:Uncharacterized protein n=1 Tax=Pistacia integerrima TaxID=434235 RepID=A0ACC0X4P4_9ROSI|nr:hypothetical protein Pint_34530 [Pistacia integerrima]
MLSIGFNPTRLTYSALIQGLCKNQEGNLAEELLKEMKPVIHSNLLACSNLTTNIKWSASEVHSCLFTRKGLSSSAVYILYLDVLDILTKLEGP